MRRVNGHVRAVHMVAEDPVGEPDRAIVLRHHPLVGIHAMDRQDLAGPVACFEAEDVLREFMDRVASGRCPTHPCA
jgi:hypothetical protein